MKVNRLFEIVYILLNKQQVTAKELADRFEVSTRTIYRDIDILSSCGVPVYASKGKGGGISLIDGYKMDKAMLTVDEQTEILSALQGLKATNIDADNNALNKMSSFFNTNETEWIEIDFSSFSSNVNWKNNFNAIKTSILKRYQLNIEYANIKGEISTRVVEPIKLMFKGVSWYLYAYCIEKNDYRMFKLNRIILLEMLTTTFTPHKDYKISISNNVLQVHNQKIELIVDKKYAFRIFDDFSKDNISENINGDFIVKINTYEKDWILSYILSFGDGIECIKPHELREEIKQSLKKTQKKYL